MIKVLLVEDDALAQMFATITLNKVLKCEITTTTRGEEAIELCKKDKYDFILMDIGLDGQIDGYNASIAIKTKKSLNEKTPIVIVTANSSERKKAEEMNNIVSHFTTKPFTPEVLQEILKKFSISQE